MTVLRVRGDELLTDSSFAAVRELFLAARGRPRPGCVRRSRPVGRTRLRRRPARRLGA